MAEHTPTPWSIYDDEDPYHIQIKGIRPDIGGAHVADALFPENAAFIVKAVNNHNALVKALEDLAQAARNEAIDMKVMHQAHAALAAVGCARQHGKD